MHAVHWMNVKVLRVTNDHNSRVIIEAFAIRTATCKGAMNGDGSALPHEYENLIAKPMVPWLLYCNVAHKYVYSYTKGMASVKLHFS